MSAPRLALVGVLSILLWSQGGCATPTLWIGATHQERYISGIEGATPPAADGSRQLVISYGTEGADDAYVALPLGPAAAPPAPLAYASEARSFKAIEQDLPLARRDAAANYVFGPAERAAARSARGAGGYQKFEPHFYHVHLRNRDAVLVALQSDGTPWPPPERRSDDDLKFPDGARLVLLPLRQPRTAADMNWSKVKAVLLAPAALAIDAAIIPIGLTARLIFGGC